MFFFFFRKAGVEVTGAVKVVILLKDMSNYGLLNAVYGEFFPPSSPLPTRVVVQPKDLPLGANIEIDVTGVKGPVVEEEGGW